MQQNTMETEPRMHNTEDASTFGRTTSPVYVIPVPSIAASRFAPPPCKHLEREWHV